MKSSSHIRVDDYFYKCNYVKNSNPLLRYAALPDALTMHFLTLGQSTAWHPDEVLRYTLIEHCMGIREKDGSVLSRNCPAFARNSMFSIRKYGLLHHMIALKQAVRRARLQEKKVSRFPLSRFHGPANACQRAR